MAGTLFLAGCGGSSAPLSTPTAPTPVPAAAPAPAAPGLTGRWIGREASTVVTWTLTQDGSMVNGPSSFAEPSAGGAGTVSGSLSASKLSFTDTYPSLTDAMLRNCRAVITGVLTVTGASMSGPYEGTNSCTGPFSGQISFTKQ
jgi:hypothetical protein